MVAASSAASTSETQRSVRAIARTERWVAGVDGAELADTIARYFLDVAPPILVAACRRYKALGIWNETPVLSRAGYQRLFDSLRSGGFVDPGTPFETAVDNGLAEEVVAAA